MMGKSKSRSRNGNKQVAASSSSKANQGNSTSWNQQPTSVQPQQQVVQIATASSTLVPQPGDFEQILRKILDILDVRNRISLMESNTSDEAMMSCINELKEKQKRLNAVRSSPDADIETLKDAMSQQESSYERTHAFLEQLYNYNKRIEHWTDETRTVCCEFRRLIDEFVTNQKSMQADLEQRLQTLTDAEEQNRKRIDLLEDKVTTLITQNEEHEKEIMCLKDKLTGTETDRAILVLRQLLTEVTTLMYKKLFPDEFISGRTYTMSFIQNCLKELMENADSVETRKFAQDKQNEYDNLLKELDWKKDMEGTIIRFKKSTGGNKIAHPDLDKVVVIEELEKLKGVKSISDKEYKMCLVFLKMWQKLK